MEQVTRRLDTVIAILLLLLAVSFAQCGDIAEAQVSARVARGTNLPGQDMRAEVVLARVCVKEAGFDGFADCAPISRVLLRVGRGDVVAGARRYSRRTFDHAALGNRPWIAYLNARGDEPMFWPSHLRWRNDRNRGNWLRMIELARAILYSEAEAPCEPHHWRNPRRQGMDTQ